MPHSSDSLSQSHLHNAVDSRYYVQGQRRPRRGPDTGIFKRFDILATGLESLATKRASSAPPTPRSLRPPPPPPVRRTAITIDDIEEVSCVEDPAPITLRQARQR